VIYAPALLRLRRDVEVHAFAHVTGGGIAGNLERVLPKGCDAHVTRGTWPEPRIFHEVQTAGSIPDSEMEQVFNLGLGMLAVVAADAAGRALETLRGTGHDAWKVGEIRPGDGHVVLAPG
jgi:phosphoribosylformylglycinamidine cyclo-ligase